MLTVDHLKNIMPGYEMGLSTIHSPKNPPVVMLLEDFFCKSVDIWNVNDKDGNTLCLVYYEHHRRKDRKRIKWVPDSPESDQLLKDTILSFLA